MKIRLSVLTLLIPMVLSCRKGKDVATAQEVQSDSVMGIFSNYYYYGLPIKPGMCITDTLNKESIILTQSSIDSFKRNPGALPYFEWMMPWVVMKVPPEFARKYDSASADFHQVDISFIRGFGFCIGVGARVIHPITLLMHTVKDTREAGEINSIRTGGFGVVLNKVMYGQYMSNPERDSICKWMITE